jgi:aspartokinase-like uncharacterized kinase
MWVVKLGGSLAVSRWLPAWLALIARAGRVVIVPGGGPFADQVRRLQRHWRLSEPGAHGLALGAMAQYGRLLCALHPDLVAVGDATEARGALARGRVAVWCACLAPGHEDGVRTDWQVSADSLAVWLSGQCAARGLLLVKSVRVTAAAVTAAELARRGIVDEAFPEFYARTGVPAVLLHRSAVELAGEILSGQTAADGATKICA